MTNIEVTSMKTRSGFCPPQNVKSTDTVIISDEARRLVEIVLIVSINGVLGVLGLVANVINIVIFVKQGFDVTVNISLCGLCISDVGAMLTLVWKSVCYNPLLQNADTDIDFIQFQFIAAGWPHRSFVSISIWITAFITFERCVCIALPLKVKDIITYKRTFITISAIFTAMFAIVVPVFVSAQAVSSFNVQRNKTMYAILYTSNGLILQNVSQSNVVCVQLSSFIIVIICTAILVHNLLIRSLWRDKVTAASPLDKSGSLSSRDQRVVKMVAFIACIFIACFFPSAVGLAIVAFYPDYGFGGRYEKFFQVIWALFGTLEAVNSSVSIFIYYNMSSKYRAVFKKLFQNRV